MKHTPQTLNFTNISCDAFLQDYWQKKPALLKQVIPNGVNPLSPEELAGLSLATEVESRIVLEHPNQTPSWQLRHGPFSDDDYKKLPKTHWTLLVQGVDRLIPEVQNLLDYFNFIPQWRVDDIMISYAAKQGSVGPHYDHYDVFLYQAQGQREWALTTQHCDDQNYVPNMDLRIMREFNTEQTFLLNPGDVLYLPPHVGHHGVSLSDDCMTYSFGYRSYHGLEILNEFCDYLNETGSFDEYYKDPNWNTARNTSELPDSTWQHAKKLLHNALSDDQALKNCFGRFATRLSASAEQDTPMPLENVNKQQFLHLLRTQSTLHRHPSCKIAYQSATTHSDFALYLNGNDWPINDANLDLIRVVANQRNIDTTLLHQFLTTDENINFLFELWQQQWLQFSCEYE